MATFLAQSPTKRPDFRASGAAARNCPVRTSFSHQSRRALFGDVNRAFRSGIWPKKWRISWPPGRPENGHFLTQPPVKKARFSGLWDDHSELPGSTIISAPNSPSSFWGRKTGVSERGLAKKVANFLNFRARHFFGPIPDQNIRFSGL